MLLMALLYIGAGIGALIEFLIHTTFAVRTGANRVADVEAGS